MKAKCFTRIGKSRNDDCKFTDSGDILGRASQHDPVDTPHSVPRATTPHIEPSINAPRCQSGRALLRHLISAPSKLSRMGLPFKDDKAGVVEVDWIMVRGPALKTGISGFDNQKIPEFIGLRYPHHTFMNNSG